MCQREKERKAPTLYATTTKAARSGGGSKPPALIPFRFPVFYRESQFFLQGFRWNLSAKNLVRVRNSVAFTAAVATAATPMYYAICFGLAATLLCGRCTMKYFAEREILNRLKINFVWLSHVATWVFAYAMSSSLSKEEKE